VSSDQAAPEARGVAVEVLATVELGADFEGMAGRRLRMRLVTIEPGGDFGPVHDHRGRPGTVYILQGRSPTIGTGRHGLRAWGGLARGSGHDPLAREQGNDPGSGDLRRYRQAGVRRDSLPSPSLPSSGGA
jgi:hypothetical protein